MIGNVRDREGLTYGIGAAVTADSIADGAWSISATFAPALLDKGIATTRRVLESWWQDGVTDSELEARKQGIVGGYFVGLSTTGGLAATILASIQRGYGLDWLDGYPAAVRGVSREAVDRAIHGHLDPASMVLVEAGSIGAPAAAPPAPAPAGSNP